MLTAYRVSVCIQSLLYCLLSPLVPHSPISIHALKPLSRGLLNNPGRYGSGLTQIAFTWRHSAWRLWCRNGVRICGHNSDSSFAYPAHHLVRLCHNKNGKPRASSSCTAICKTITIVQYWFCMAMRLRSYSNSTVYVLVSAAHAWWRMVVLMFELID